MAVEARSQGSASPAVEQCCTRADNPGHALSPYFTNIRPRAGRYRFFDRPMRLQGLRSAAGGECQYLRFQGRASQREGDGSHRALQHRAQRPDFHHALQPGRYPARPARRQQRRRPANCPDRHAGGAGDDEKRQAGIAGHRRCVPPRGAHQRQQHGSGADRPHSALGQQEQKGAEAIPGDHRRPVCRRGSRASHHQVGFPLLRHRRRQAAGGRRAHLPDGIARRERKRAALLRDSGPSGQRGAIVVQRAVWGGRHLDHRLGSWLSARQMANSGRLQPIGNRA